MSLSEVDRQLLQRCLEKAPRAWQDFVDRFLGLVIHVANHTAKARNISLDQSSLEDLVSEVFLCIVANDMGVLRRFRRNCSLATYLTVVSRRVIIRRLLAIKHFRSASAELNELGVDDPPSRIENQDEVQNLIQRLDPKEANIVRMYHLEGKSYSEISQAVGITENSIGPVLSRARAKMRNGNGHSPS